jgi:2-iminobutanoate/2-iminopropanoate deaminase
MAEIIETKHAPAPIGPYSQAVSANGFLVVEGGIETQTHRVMKNLSAILEAAGSGLDRVIKTTVFLSDLEDFSGFNGAYAEYFEEIKPARSTVQVGRLPKDVLLEMEAIAVS